MSIVEWNELGGGHGRLDAPAAVAMDADGLVYVADSNNHRIVCFHPDGTFLHQWGRRGTGNGEFVEPLGLAISTHTPAACSDRGETPFRQALLDVVTTVVEINRWPPGVAGLCASYLPDGSVYVSDTQNHRIQVFGWNGAWLATWGGLGDERGQLNTPCGCSSYFHHYLKMDLLYVCDSKNCRIQIFGSDGKVQSVFRLDITPLVVQIDVDYSFLVKWKVGREEAVCRIKGQDVETWSAFAAGEQCFGQYDDSGEPFAFWSVGQIHRGGKRYHCADPVILPAFMDISGAVIHSARRKLYVADRILNTVVVIPLELFSE